MKIRKSVNKLRKVSLLLTTFVFFVLPASTSYNLEGYAIGGGGEVGASTSFSGEAILGQVAGKQTGTSFKSNTGLIFMQEANTPAAPTFQNNGDWYNKLFFIINTSGNPSDAKYAIAITDDNWVTTQWVQTDNTISSTFGIGNFQTYAAWGGASGGYIIGLRQNVEYKIKVKARTGIYTEGPLGVEATVSTSPVSLTVDIDVSSTDTETAAPYLVDMGSLTVGSVKTATDKIWVDFATNAASGGQVFIKDQNTGLNSATTSYTIASSTTDLSLQSEGFGIRGDSVAQTSGGPISFQSPYNGASENVGIVDTTIRPILSTSNPIVGGRASIFVKAKASATTPAANNYTDIFTVIAAGSF